MLSLSRLHEYVTALYPIRWPVTVIVCAHGILLTYMIVVYLIHPTIQKRDRTFNKNSESDSFEDDSSDEPLNYQEMKLIMVVNSDLKMGKGKIGAQCGHATLGAIQNFKRKGYKGLSHYLRYGQAKVCVKASESEFIGLIDNAKQLNIPYYVVVDAGRTQIASGSRTVLAIGPGPVGDIDKITGNLKLL